MPGNSAAASDWNDAVVYLIDDDTRSRESMTRLLTELGVPVQAFDSIAAFEKGYDPDRIACLLLGLGQRLKALIDVLATLRSLDEGLPIILVAPDADIPTAVAAFKAGAFDLIEAPLQSQSLVEKVNRAIVHHREALYQVRVRDRAAARFSKLSQRELEVLKLVIAGLTTAQIAQKLSRSPKTIEAHRSRILNKTRSASVGELVQLAIRAGILGSADGESDPG